MACKNLFFLFFILLCTQLFAQTSNWATYQNGVCSIQYPPNFKEEPITEQYIGLGIQFMLTTEAENSKDKFFENMNMVTEERQAPITLQQYVSAIVSSMPSVVEKFKLKSSTTSKNASGEYAILEYTGNMSGSKLAWYQCVWIKGLNAYVLSFTGAQSTYKKYKPQYVAMAASFTIKAAY